MRIATSTLALALLAAAPAATAVERADTVATYVGGIGAHSISGSGIRVVLASRVGGDDEIFIWAHLTHVFPITEEANKPGTNDVDALDVDFDGTAVAAIASGDLADTGATTSELYRWTDGAGWQRLTFTQGQVAKVGAGLVAISEDGTRIAFNSRDDYTGENPTGEAQIFLWREGAGIRQVTHGAPCGAGGGNFLRDLSGDGRRILFASRCKYGDSNADLGDDLFLWDETVGVRALAETPNGDTIASASLNRDGSVAALISPDDLTREGVSGYFLYRWLDGRRFQRLTKEPTSRSTPSISADGRRIAYTAENGQGNDEINPEGSEEIFFWQQGLRQVAALTDSRQTDSDAGNGGPRLSADGTRLSMVALRAFDAPADLRSGHYVIDVLSPQKARPNLLVNGSFELGLRGWRSGQQVVYSADDAKGDPASGSALQVNERPEGGDVSSISQCVPALASTEYLISALLRVLPHGIDDSGSARIGVRLHATSACSGVTFAPLIDAGIVRDDGAWIGAHRRFVTGPATVAVEVVLTTRKDQTFGSLEAGFDDVVLRRDNEIKILH